MSATSSPRLPSAPAAAAGQRAVRPALLALGLAIVVAVAASASAQFTLAELTAVTDRRAQMRQGRLELVQLLSLFKDLETGARGYALTGDESYLQPYHQAVAAIPPTYAECRARLRTEGIEDFSWAQLDERVRQRLQLATALVQARREHGAGVVDDVGLLNAGKEAMDGIRQLSARLDTFHQQQIAATVAELKDIRQRAALLGWLATLAIAGLIGTSTYLLLGERRARLRLEAALRETNEGLEARVQARTRELDEAHGRIRHFAAEQQDSVAREQQRISREVHDQIGAVFTGIRMILHGLPPGALPAEQAQALQRATDMGIATARRIAAELRPPLLDDLGLQAALEQLLTELFGRSGVAFEIALEAPEGLDGRQALGIHRIVQEAATNVLRHAGARHFKVSGAPLAEGGYCLRLSDDGVGMASAGGRRGALGLTGMRERAELLDGRLEIAGQPLGGLLLTLYLPAPAAPERP